MEYKRTGDNIIARLDPGEEICGQILKIADKEKIRLAEISGLGAVNEFTSGVFDTETKKYHANEFKGAYEIVSLTGTITQKDGQAYLHAHFAAGDSKGHVLGGHLNKATVSATAEIIIHVIPGTVERKFDERIGLNLFSLDS